MTRRCQVIQAPYWEKVRKKDLTANEILVELFLITFRDCGASGILIAAPSTIAYYTGLDEGNCNLQREGQVTLALRLLEDHGRIVRCPGNWIWVKGKWEYESTKTEQVQKSVITDLQSCPESLMNSWLQTYGDTLNPTLTVTLNPTLTSTLCPKVIVKVRVKDEVKVKQEIKDVIPPKEKLPSEKEIKMAADSRQITDLYQKFYIERFNRKPAWGKQEGKRVRELLERYSLEDVLKIIEIIFTVPDELISPHLGTFRSCLSDKFCDRALTLKGGNGKPKPKREMWSSAAPGTKSEEIDNEDYVSAE